MSQEEIRKELVTYQSKIKPECRFGRTESAMSRIPRPVHNLPRVNRVEGKAMKSTLSAAHQPAVAMRSAGQVPSLNDEEEKTTLECKPQVIDLTQEEADDDEDVDIFDLGDPQLCAEYAQDIYRYLKYLEKQPNMLTRKNFLVHQVPQMPRYRTILVDWIVGICSHFHLLQETLFLSVDLLDRYLGNCVVSKHQLQLVGVACLYVASKYEEIYPPFLSDFIQMTDHTYTKKELLHMERVLLASLRYELGKPLPVHFLRRFSKLADADTREHNLAKYILECALHVATTSPLPPSLKAAGALYLSRSLLRTTSTIWPQCVSKHSEYTVVHIHPVLEPLKSSVRAVHCHSVKHIKYTYKKYQKDKFMRVGSLSVLGELLQEQPSQPAKPSCHPKQS